MSYRWVVLIAGCVGTSVVGALRQGMPALGPAIRDEYALTVGEVGFAFAAMAAGMTVGLVPWGALADRTGERPVLAGGLLAAAGGLAGAAFAGSFGTFLAGLFVCGLFAAAATGASGRAIMGWFARGERGFVLGIRQTAIPVGGAVAALSLPAIAIAASLEGALLWLAAFTALAAIVGGVLLRDPPHAETPKGFSAPPPMRDGRIWRLGLGSGLFVMAQAAVIGFTVLFLVDEHGHVAGRGGARPGRDPDRLRGGAHRHRPAVGPHGAPDRPPAPRRAGRRLLVALGARCPARRTPCSSRCSSSAARRCRAGTARAYSAAAGDRRARAGGDGD
jgi:MFS family permease